MRAALGIFLTLGLLAFYVQSYANTVEQRIVINSGFFSTVDGDSIPAYAYNKSTNFSSENSRIILNGSDSLVLWVVNNTSEDHDFVIKGLLDTISIASHDSALISFRFNVPGTHLFYDPSQNGRFSAMGLSSMLVVIPNNPNYRHFYWNLNDMQSAFNRNFNDGLSVDWSQYYPEHFTINGKRNPNINSDSSARVTGAVGDSIYIHVTNSGRAIHSIHFHGYHVRIVESSAHPEHIGRVKDTCPIESMETIVLELIPHQTGEYPVHDHNLVAVTGAGIYPNGMFTTILIQ